MKKLWIMIAIVISLLAVVIAVQAYNGILHEENDVANYLTADSEFTYAASIFLPERVDLVTSQVSDYVHGRYNRGTEYLYFTVSYSPSQYEAAKEFARNRLELAWKEYAAYGYGETFLLNDREFQCCTVYVEKDYAYAYHASDDDYTITYLFLTDSNLEYMSVVDFMELYTKK